ncbi:MAG: phosphoenolpyruvate--protein phosphotransferase, partial [Spirochaetaceae bacterium]|nr:phosphoenolpyruvate--protein phosphotransferase [Spirochaetaceae bacterium]
MKDLSGIPVSKGLAIGKALLYLEDALPEIPRYSISETQVDEEWRRFLSATTVITEEIRQKLKETPLKAGKDRRDILEAQLFMFEDVDFHENVKGGLESRLQNIESVVWDVSQELIRKLSALPGAEFRARTADVSGMAQELLNKLLSIKTSSLANLNEAVVVVARDLLPSQALAMDKDFVMAVVTDAGSPISHTAIIARAAGIPAVMGLSYGSARIKSGDMLIVDGDTGHVFINPDKKTLALYQNMIKENRAKSKMTSRLNGHSARTKDGRLVTLKVNMETPSELKKALSHGAEGVGLYRSEFFFLARGMAADEESQYST